MRIETGQHLRIDQRMKLAPRMIQSMEILQMPAMALEERIEQELASNPTLELVDPAAEAGAERDSGDKDRAEQQERDSSEGERELVITDESVDASHADDFERLNNFSEEYGEAWAEESLRLEPTFRPASADPDRDRKLEALANTAARPEGLTEQLIAQWSLLDLPPAIDKAGRHLIAFIDDDGYLRTDRQALLDQAPAGVSAADLDQAWRAIQQSLEPAGIGAADLRQCLLLQIDAKARAHAPGVSAGTPPARHPDSAAVDLSVERLLVSDYLKDINANRLPQIAKATGLPLERIKQAIANLRQFHPHPGRLLIEDRPQTITPDAVVEYDEGQDRYVARLTHDRLPNVQINSRYLRMARDQKLDRSTRQFVENNLRSARWLIDAIQQRHSTLLRVIQVVVNAQRDFFDQGPQYLKPLPMTQVADQLGVHVATISRAVSEKYIQTPRGIFPLRMFFSGGTQTESGDEVSWSAIQAKLEQIITEEDKSNPLSDDQLADKLSEHGIDIARRTVAKYRKQLNIPPARQRRQY